jgi:hypothetical protein
VRREEEVVYVGERGCGFGAYTAYLGGHEESTKDIYAKFGPQKKVHWLNAPDASTMQESFYYPSVRFFLLFLLAGCSVAACLHDAPQYGNHVELRTCYTYAALLVSIRRKGAVVSAGRSAAQRTTSAKKGRGVAARRHGGG